MVTKKLTIIKKLTGHQNFYFYQKVGRSSKSSPKRSQRSKRSKRSPKKLTVTKKWVITKRISVVVVDHFVVKFVNKLTLYREKSELDDFSCILAALGSFFVSWRRNGVSIYLFFTPSPVNISVNF